MSYLKKSWSRPWKSCAKNLTSAFSSGVPYFSKDNMNRPHMIIESGDESRYLLSIQIFCLIGRSTSIHLALAKFFSSELLS